MKYKHIDGVDVTPIFSDDKKFRYKLEIIKTNPLKSDRKTVCVIMQNPSYANKNFADKSVQFIEKLIFCKDYEEFKDVYKILVVNQFAYIQTQDFKGNDKNIGVDNDRYIKSAINDSDIILIAWGKSNSYYDRQEVINCTLRSTSNKKMYKTKLHPRVGHYKNFISAYSP